MPPIHPVRFGFCVPIFASPGGGLFRAPNYETLDTAVTLQLARTAEALGYDTLWVADHLMLGRDDAILEGWTVLAALGGSTQRARLGLLHQANLFRHPALAAKMAATLDQITGGRLIYYPDGGNNQREHVAYGLPWHADQEERIARMVEGLELTLALWSSEEQPISYAGRYYRVQDAVCRPAPVQRPHPPVWMGEVHPATLDACARYGQGWHTTPVRLPELNRRLQALDEACRRVGRSYDELEKAMATQILIAPDRAGIRERLCEMVALASSAYENDEGFRAFLNGDTEDIPDVFPDAWFMGTPDDVAQKLRTYIDAGITHYLLWFMDIPRQDGLRLFAEQVAPLLR